MATISEATRGTGAFNFFGSGDMLELLPDAILDDLTHAVDLFEPLTPLELVLSDWESVETDPVLPMATIPTATPTPTPTPTPTATSPTPMPAASVPLKTERHVANPPVSPLPSMTTGATQQRPPMKNPSRERLRAELRFLRQRVVEMERELQVAKAQQQQQIQTRKRVAVKWDHVAQDELRKRQRAEDVNRQLRSALTKQTRIAKSLERLLEDQDGAEAFARFCDTGHVTSPHLKETPSAEAEYARLEDEVVRAYASVDGVLNECNMGDAEVLYTSSQTEVKTTAANEGAGHPQILLEHLATKFVPFDFGRTCDAFWRALSTPAVYEHHDVDMLVEAGNTIRFSSRLPWTFNGEQRKLRCMVVMKRYTTANRMVVVWRGAMTTEDPSTRVPWVAAGWEETGWIVVREIDDQGGIEDERPCVVQTIMRHIPSMQTTSAVDPAQSERELGAFSTMVLTATEDDMAHITGAMQSLLLAEVLDGVSAAAASEQ